MANICASQLTPGWSVGLRYWRWHHGAMAPPRHPATSCCHSAVPSVTACRAGSIGWASIRRGRCVATQCSGHGDLYACADGADEPITAAVPHAYSEALHGVNKGDISEFLKHLMEGFAVSIENVIEMSESAAVISWQLELHGKSVPFARGRAVYEYTREAAGDQLAFRNVRLRIERRVTQQERHLECDHLIKVASPRLEESLVVSKERREGYQSSVRTSYGMFLDSSEQANPIVQAIEKRIALFTHVPKENGEAIQVLRYQKDQHFTPHHDYFSNETGNDRIATMLIYLNADFEGGETYFPKVGYGECLCGGLVEKGWSIKPAKGDAVLFWSLGLDGKMDPDTLHAGCDVLDGEKWVAIKWLHGKNFRDECMT